MTVEQMQKEVWYYLGLRATKEEAEELLGFVEDNPKASLSEIISDYYNA